MAWLAWGTPEEADGYWQVKHVADRAVAEATIWDREKVGKAMEKFGENIWCLRREKHNQTHLQWKLGAVDNWGHCQEVEGIL